MHGIKVNYSETVTSSVGWIMKYSLLLLQSGIIFKAARCCTKELCLEGFHCAEYYILKKMQMKSITAKLFSLSFECR